MNWIPTQQYLPGTCKTKILIRLVSLNYTDYEIISVKNDPLLCGKYLIKKSDGIIEEASVESWTSLTD
jgi:hypothetical protein